MIHTTELTLPPHQAGEDTIILEALCKKVTIAPAQLADFVIRKRSLDARKKEIVFHLKIDYALKKQVGENFRIPLFEETIQYKDVRHAAKEVAIIGLGPAGTYAALRLIEMGIRPVIFERGKEVRERRRDLAELNKKGVVNPDSNYCFGEGGAGTYSDGKLYTRSTKRGSFRKVLQVFYEHGAEERILYEAHPHIGTNKLPAIVSAMRETILKYGGKIHFNSRVTGLKIENDEIQALEINNQDTYAVKAVILAAGHSARDIFTLLESKKILIEAKPFALGVRIEHAQSLIDNIQYHLPDRGDFLPPASYSLVEQVMGKGVFSFCMCPGGIIAPAATAPGEVVVNGWSPSKRNGKFSNSGMVVSVELQDIPEFARYGNLAALEFQHMVEQKAFEAGGHNLQAPAQRVVDFCERKISSTLPECSYVPGLNSYALDEVLPAFISERLRKGLQAFGKKMRGYYTNDAVLVGVESRTSSPVKIPRDKDTLQHPQIKNLYPCGEGAGYAGGIASAAMDGERVANMM